MKMWRKENANALLVGMKIAAATMEDSMEFPQKIKNRIIVCFSNFWIFI